jgi:hypothetical protein
MRALSIRQPFAELILRGVKRIEYRSRPTRIIGERFWIYASKGSGFGIRGSEKKLITGDNIAVPDAPLPPWMIELAEGLKLWKPGELPTGVIVGSAVIEKVTRNVTSRFFEWHLAGVERAAQMLKPARQPQPSWFRPF